MCKLQAAGLIVFFVLLGQLAQGVEAGNGKPFGEISDKDVTELYDFAKARGWDLKGDLNKAYQENPDALGKVFKFSTQLIGFDQNTRTYGHIIYCSFLNLGESWGVEPYGKVLAKQEQNVQQRIRAFILHEVKSLPQSERLLTVNETKAAYPSVFPTTYVFEKDSSSTDQVYYRYRRHRFRRR